MKTEITRDHDDEILIPELKLVFVFSGQALFPGGTFAPLPTFPEIPDLPEVPADFPTIGVPGRLLVNQRG